MNSYIVCLESADAPPVFEIAICESEEEARDWAASLLAFVPGFDLARILPPRAAAPPAI